ncbi:cytochrome P450 [Lophiotrema nucula]|uniref:Cytochrome P450 n=1 Tax=Lophiotrema nucula TaxID=690887 RepID=A0A6A5ZJQ7_9PLEO|nr:cytochrome P450 [Lophiotrema nucula]
MAPTQLDIAKSWVTKQSPTTVLIGYGIAVYILYLIYLVVYRLYFHPLAKFPGPKLNALTFWVETYYELFKGEGGQFPWAYAKWHQKYGPIVRITPDELHIQDSQYHEYFFHPSRPVDKPAAIANRFGNPLSAFASTKHADHKMRRSALNPFFSKRKIAAFSPKIQNTMDKLVNKLIDEYAGTGRVVSLNKMWGCVSSDSIVGYAYERQYNFVDQPEFAAPLNQAMMDLLEPVHWVVQFPLLNTIMQSLPDWLLVKMEPKMESVVKFNKELTDQITSILSQPKDTEKSTDNTIFRELLDSGLPSQELTLTRLHHESISIIGAGVESTMRTLVVCCFHVLEQPQVRERLFKELKEAVPDPSNMPGWDDLAKLPYLSACIEESLRLSYGTSQRMPRIYNGGPLPYPQQNPTHMIPAGTNVSMDIYPVSHDEVIFPSSFDFVPERWLDDPKAPDGRKLSRYMVSFGKGTRSCTGMQLGYAELYIALANFFLKLDGRVKLYKTTKRDVELARDRFAPKMYKGCQGVRVVIE